jgi:hypothetical protein
MLTLSAYHCLQVSIKTIISAWRNRGFVAVCFTVTNIEMATAMSQFLCPGACSLHWQIVLKTNVVCHDAFIEFIQQLIIRAHRQMRVPQINSPPSN